MALSNKEVVNRWFNKETDSGKAKQMHFEKETIFSKGEPIAKYIDGDHILFVEVKDLISPAHQKLVEKSIDDSDEIWVFKVATTETHAKNIDHYFEKANRKFEQLIRSKSKFYEYKDGMQEFLAEMDVYLSYFGLQSILCLSEMKYIDHLLIANTENKWIKEDTIKNIRDAFTIYTKDKKRRLLEESQISEEA